MEIYERKRILLAIEFTEERYQKNPLEYPFVFDRANFSEMWCGKKVDDGRYYIMNHTNTIGFRNETVLSNGDYILREDDGWLYSLPKQTFEKNYTLS